MEGASSDDADYVFEEPEDEEKDSGAKRRKTVEVELLKAEELDDIWAEMNAGPSASVAKMPSAPVANSVKKKGEEKKVVVAKKESVDVTALLAELESDKPKMTKETVRFAGKDVEVLMEAKEPKKTKKSDGGDQVASLIDELKGKTKKINTMQKSELDWNTLKLQDKEVGDELQAHMRGNTYLDKQSFLKRAEWNEYERERDGKRK